MYQNDLGLGDTVATSFLLVLDIGNRPTCHQHCHSHDKKHPSTAYHYTGYTDKKRSIHFSMHQLETAPLEPPQLRRRNVRNTYPTFMTHPSSFAQQFPAHDDCTRGGFCCKDGMPRSLPGSGLGSQSKDCFTPSTTVNSSRLHIQEEAIKLRCLQDIEPELEVVPVIFMAY